MRKAKPNMGSPFASPRRHNYREQSVNSEACRPTNKPGTKSRCKCHIRCIDIAVTCTQKEPTKCLNKTTTAIAAGPANTTHKSNEADLNYMLQIGYQYQCN